MMANLAPLTMVCDWMMEVPASMKEITCLSTKPTTLQEISEYVKALLTWVRMKGHCNAAIF